MRRTEKTMKAKITASVQRTFGTVANRLCVSSPGLYAIERLVRVLYTVELTARWMLPDAVADANASDVHDRPERPLPWLLFLPIIVALRLSVAIERRVVWVLSKTPFDLWRMVVRLQHWQRELRFYRHEIVRQQLERRRQRARSSSVFQRLMRLVSGWGSMDRLFDGDTTDQSSTSGDEANNEVSHSSSRRKASSAQCLLRHNDTIQDLITKRYHTEGETSDSSFHVPAELNEATQTTDASSTTDSEETESDYESMSHQENVSNESQSVSLKRKRRPTNRSKEEVKQQPHRPENALKLNGNHSQSGHHEQEHQQQQKRPAKNHNNIQPSAVEQSAVEKEIVTESKTRTPPPPPPLPPKLFERVYSVDHTQTRAHDIVTFDNIIPYHIANAEPANNGLNGCFESIAEESVEAAAAASNSDAAADASVDGADDHELNGTGSASVTEIMSKNKRRRMKKKQLSKEKDPMIVQLNEHDEDKENGGIFVLNM